MKKLFAILFIISTIICNFSFVLHPYHVGSVEFNYNTKSKSFEITGKFFIDDLETAVSKKMGKHLQFQNASNKNNMEQGLKQYCIEAIKLKVNNKNIPIQFVGYQEDKESVEIFLETSAIATPKKIDTSVRFLYNLYDDQMNIVHIIINGKRKSSKLVFPNTELTQQF
jgi:hypothetical protein